MADQAGTSGAARYVHSPSRHLATRTQFQDRFSRFGLVTSDQHSAATIAEHEGRDGLPDSDCASDDNQLLSCEVQFHSFLSFRFCNQSCSLAAPGLVSAWSFERTALCQLFLLEAKQVRSSIVTRDVEGHCLPVNLHDIEVPHDELFTIHHGSNNVKRIRPDNPAPPPPYPLPIPHAYHQPTRISHR